MSTQASVPGPHLDLVPELIRWFGHWLRDDNNGIDAEPPIAVFARRSTRPEPDLAMMRGEWRAEETWPPSRLGDLTLSPEGAADDIVPGCAEVGRHAWISCAGRLPWGLPGDQRTDDALSLTYDWAPLDDELDVMGYPRVRLTVTSPVPVAYLSARLCDVFPDGTSALAGRGVLNLTHRSGSTSPVALEPGVPTEIELELEVTSWIFEPGHRVRLALSTSDWPNTWPPPSLEPLIVNRSSVELILPVLDGPSGLDPQPFVPAAGIDMHAAPPEGEQPSLVWRFEDDVLGREVRAVTSSGSNYAGPFDAVISELYEGTVGVSTQEPGVATAHGRSLYTVTWPEAEVRTEATLEVRSDPEEYHVVVVAVAEEIGGAKLFRHEQRWERTFPRRLA